MTEHTIGSSPSTSATGGIVAVLYGAVSYLLFLATFLYAIAFVGNLPVPKTIDSGAAGTARPGAGRSTRCCSACSPSSTASWRGPPSSAGGHASCRSRSSARPTCCSRAWRCCCSTGSGGRCRTSIWSVTNPAARSMLQAVFWLGWAMVLVSTFLINHFELFGLHQVLCAPAAAGSCRRRCSGRRCSTSAVRHPIYLGFLLAFWATPTMTRGPSAVRDRHHRLHPDRHLARGARSDRACSATSTAATASRSRC